MKRAIGRSAVVLLAIALAAGLTEGSFALGADLTFEWYLAVVACVAWWCGRNAALAAAVLSATLIDFVFLPFHDFSFGMGLTDAGRLVAFIALALLVTHLVTGRRAAEEERMRREQLLAAVAHELGNRIFALRTWTAILQRERLPSVQLEQSARALAHTADAIGRLASDLLDWSRVALGRLDLQPADFDLAEIANDAIAELASHAAALGVRLSSSLSPAPVHADRQRLHQVALNLLTNSLKATRPGGEVAVSVRAADHRAVFSVRDTGHGISRQMLDRLFDLGASGAESTGLGVGLALSRDLVRAQGGDVTVFSRGPGLGATFSVQLPTAAASEHAPR